MRSLDSEQVAYARDIVARLWPAPAQVIATTRPAPRPEGLAAEWLLLPSPSRPTLLIPAGLARGASMLQRHGDRMLPRMGRAGLAWGVRTGVLQRFPTSRIQVAYPPGTPAAPTSALAHLTKAVASVKTCGVILGTPRPNRKPVLQLFSALGETEAFVKVGVSEYTRQLVATEAANLEFIESSSLRTITAPRVLHLGSFGELDLLAISALHSSQVRRESTIPWAAMRELAHLSAVRDQPLKSSAYWDRLTRALREAGTQPGASECAQLLQRITQRWGSATIDLGSWHGDWAPWNMGYRDGIVELWDWERYAQDVPMGFDPIHFKAQHVRHGRDDTSEREDALVAEIPDVLDRMDVSTASREPMLILALYLLEISVRFAGMATEGAKMHPRQEWALGFAARLVNGR